MKKITFIFVFALVIAMTGSVGSINNVSAADPQYFAGHYYQIVYQYPVTWQEAKTLASEMTYSVGNTVYHGHLAVITSAEENLFIYDNLVAGAQGNPEDEFSSGRAWIGASQLDNQSNPSAGWKWVTGEDFNYINWDNGSPNDGDSGGENNIENYMEMRGGGYWDDVANSAEWVVNYVVELEPIPTFQGVGGEVYPVNKMSLLVPWVAIAVVILVGVTYLVRRKDQG
jgi:hypothetical protein